MSVLPDRVDRDDPTFVANRDSMLAQLAELDEQLDLARAGGGERYVERHRARGKLTARERIEALLDPDSPFLELSPLAAWGSTFAVGASVVTGIGVVHGVECVISANDPTVKGGTSNPFTLEEVVPGLRHRLRQPDAAASHLVESGGADLPTQSEIFLPGGRSFRDLTRLSAAGIPTIALVFGNSTAGGAYVPGLCDHVVMVKGGAKVFLGGPPLVKMATGEDARRRGAGRRRDARPGQRPGRLPRRRRARLHPHRPRHRPPPELAQARARGPAPPTRRPAARPRGDLLGLAPADLRQPFDPQEVIGRVLDGSELDEFKPLYGPSLVTGWGELCGYPVGILANDGRALQRGEREGHPVHPAGQPARHARCCSSRTSPATWSARSTSSAAWSRTARR